MPKRNDPTLLKQLGARIRAERTRLGYSPDELAEAAGISRPTLVNVENGRHGVSLTSLYDIAEALDIEASRLLPSMLAVGRHGEVAAVVTRELGEVNPRLMSSIEKAAKMARKKHE